MNIFAKVRKYVPNAPTSGDADINTAFLISELVRDKVELPENLKRQLAEELNPWFLACLEPDEFGPDDLPWENFDQLYYEWLDQAPSLPRP